MSSISQNFSELYEKATVLYQNSAERSQDFPNLSSSEEHYLDILYSLNNPTLTTFSKKAKISKPAATRIIHQFESKNYVTKVQSEQDGRVQYLVLSDALKDHFRHNLVVFDRVFSDIISCLSEDEQNVLARILEKINQTI